MPYIYIMMYTTAQIVNVVPNHNIIIIIVTEVENNNK